MKKAVVILRSLVIKRKLKDVCKALHISYKYCYAVSQEEKSPSYDLMLKLQFIIYPMYWFEEADKEFLLAIKEAMMKKNDEQTSPDEQNDVTQES